MTFKKMPVKAKPDENPDTLSARLTGEHKVLGEWVRDLMKRTMMPTVSSQLIALLHEARNHDIEQQNDLGAKNLNRGSLRK